MFVNRNTLFCLMLAGLGGCAGMSEQACVTADWRTIGFEDGTLGRSEAMIGNYRKQCGEHGVTPNLDAYRAGHAEGVQSFCRSGHGFDVGHSGAQYEGVCPANLEPAFLAQYNAGHRLFELESALNSVDARIANDHRTQDGIKHELAAIAATMIAPETTNEQRIMLVSRSAELGRRYGELTKEIEQLEYERVAHARDLYDYQQTLARN